MEVLRRPAEGRAWSCYRLVGDPSAQRDFAGGICDCDGRARRRGATRRFSRRSAGACRHDFRVASGAQSDSSGSQRQPWGPSGCVALRPAHGSLRASAWHGSPRGSQTHQRSYRRARLRPWYDRPAAVDLHGFHREWHGRDGRWSRFRGDSRQIRVVGADCLGRCVAGDTLASARERNLARPQHRRGARRAERCRLCLPAGGGPACEQGVAVVWSRPLDHRPFHRQTHTLARASIRSDTSARASCHLEHAPGHLCECFGALVSGEGRCAWPHQSWGSGGIRAECRRSVDDRVWRIQLGA